MLIPMKYLLGLHAENNLLKTALLRKEKGVVFLENVQSFFPSDSFVKQLYISFPLPEKKEFTIACALQPQDVLFRTLSLPIPQQRKALAALPFQLEAILPFPLEEAHVAAHCHRIGREASAITLFATRDSALTSHLQGAQGLHIDPDFLSCVPNALYRLCRWLFPQEKGLSIFHFGEVKSCCILSTGTDISLVQTVHFGYRDFLQALVKDFPHQDPHILLQDPSLTQDPPPHFRQVKERIEKEVDRLVCYLHSKHFPPENTEWIFLGDLYPAIPPALFWKEAKKKEISDLPLTPSIVQEYAIPIGTALDALASDSHSVQFLRGKWTPARHREKAKKRASTFLTLCLAATVLLGLGGNALLNKRAKTFSEQLLSYLPSNLAKGSPQSLPEWKQLLSRWERSLNQQQLPFPFFPTVPSVSDVLAWLSTHPVLSVSGEGEKEGIEVKNIHYQLYKYPKLGEKRGGYAAKVDVELTTSTPRLAREFHDALLKGDRLVNAKKEIKWNAQQNTYWASFELNPLKKEGR